MRLGQLARKYDVSTQEIVSYLKKMDPTNGTIHPNAKLDERTEQLLVAHFDLLLDSPKDSFAEETFESVDVHSEVDNLMPNETAEIEEPSDLEIVPEKKVEDKVDQARNGMATLTEASPEEVITSDKLLALIESDEQVADLSKITLIKAPKKELNGLKVLGKIELPEPRKAKSQKESEKKLKAKTKKENRLTDEEAEKRRLWAKKKKEENDARLEKKRKEKEKQQLKALREAHYKQRLQQNRPKTKKQRHAVEEIVSHHFEQDSSSEPKSIFGRFWRWLNT